MTHLYTPKQARDILGVSPSALRTHSTTYARYLSTEATGNPRNFTDADLRVLAFVVNNTGMGKQHKDILQMLADDAPEFAAFDWHAPASVDAGEPMQTALVPAERLQAAQALMVDAQRREQEARAQLEARERELLDQVGELRQALGRAEGKLEALEATQQRRSWWARMFGGGD